MSKIKYLLSFLGFYLLNINESHSNVDGLQENLFVKAVFLKKPVHLRAKSELFL